MAPKRRTSGSVPDAENRFRVEIGMPALRLAPDAEAHAAPVDHRVSVARAREQSLLDQREALRLDRAGRYAESRQAFAASHARLEEVEARAAATGYAGLSEQMVAELRSDTVRAMDLSAAPAAPLAEAVHKERAAYRARHCEQDERCGWVAGLPSPAAALQMSARLSSSR